ncbi:glycolate oxidase [Culex quinquefasciatus]|uniref:(S)-2-hydroxy-acid oxidase n=1 Tax=Culex quinquefasciatus TaxID=7176 RepID=B0X407_CULQU|nr:glycolate oxidase [Culex quinquefasciatus]|eukprot:XP_001864379.1 glycolate oxidase [Culex quinquefasciatus]
MSKAPRWFQLYIFKDRRVTKKLVKRAEKAGYRAIVLTVDAPVFGIRRADNKNRFQLPPNITFANMDDGKQQRDYGAYYDERSDPALTWDDVEWLLKLTKLPVIVKGILTKEDALIAVDRGAQGIWVSNHGARQVDSEPATIEVLPEIVAAVADRIPIIIDGGVTQGTDVFKALALGAKMVCIGRPALWGLAVNGQQGVENVLDILKKELDNVMAIAGCHSIADIIKDFVAHESSYEKI